MAVRPRTWSEWMPWLVALLFIPPVLLLIETIRGAVHDNDMLAKQTKLVELQQLRRRAARRAEGISVISRFGMQSPEGAATWVDDPAVRQYWNEIKTTNAPYLYTAVVGRRGKILLHSDPSRVGEFIDRGWYDRRLTEIASDVTWTRESPLAGGKAVYDVSVKLDGPPEDAHLHVGLDAVALDSKAAGAARQAAFHWAGVLAVVGVVDLLAVWAILSMMRHHGRLHRALVGQARRRAKELAQLGSGLAHEIRNPLHALRINLHMLRRALGGKSSLPPEQVVATIDESDGAINRLDGLMRDLLMFSDPTQGHVARVDLVQEVQATLRLLAEDLKREQIDVREALPPVPAPITIDPTRLRQSLLNLITFAQHRSGKSGTIEVAVARTGEGVELSVADSGPAVAADKQMRMFEPFQATAETGSGLGLALVQTYVEEVGGKVSCIGDASTKNRCRVWFPLAEPAKGGSL